MDKFDHIAIDSDDLLTTFIQKKLLAIITDHQIKLGLRNQSTNA